jgi:hypothetical protein
LGGPITVTNGRGFFTAQVSAPSGGQLRASWASASPPYFASSRAYPVS